LPGDRSLFAGIGDDQTGIDREAFAADQLRGNARLHHALEHVSENIAVAEALIASARECRMVRDRILDDQAAREN
jgi:hypothetical protein